MEKKFTGVFVTENIDLRFLPELGKRRKGSITLGSNAHWTVDPAVIDNRKGRTP